MADLQFNEPQEFSRYQVAPKPSFLAKLVLSTGIVGTERAAQYALLILCVLFTAAAFWVVFSPSSSAPSSTSVGPNLKMIKELSNQQPYY